MEKIPRLREMTPKERRQYIWDYYRIPIIVTIIGLIVLVYEIYQASIRKEIIMETVMVNSMVTLDYEKHDQVQAAFDLFMKEHGYNPEEQTIQVSDDLYLSKSLSSESDYSNLTKLDVLVGAGSISVLFAEDNIFDTLANRGYFFNLTEKLSPELLEKWEDSLVYHTVQETRERYPVGIRLQTSEHEWIASTGAYNKSCVMAICNNREHEETAQKFIKFILDDEGS